MIDLESRVIHEVMRVVPLFFIRDFEDTLFVILEVLPGSACGGLEAFNVSR